MSLIFSKNEASTGYRLGGIHQEYKPLLSVPANANLSETYFTTEKTSPKSYTDNRYSLKYVFSDNFLFGTISYKEDDEKDLTNNTLAAFRIILSTCQSLAMPNILRLWHYLPNINLWQNGEERYHKFNTGRRQAFAEFTCSLGLGAPAACGIGMGADKLHFTFLASKKKSLAIENPRQTSAYHYPKEYGVCSPIFSRASLLEQQESFILWISGTASIVGHQTIHQGDVLAQTQESLTNITILLEQANISSKLSFAMSDLFCRVYVRNKQDLNIVNKMILKSGIDNAVFFQGDICRSDLLVEIEASSMKFK